MAPTRIGGVIQLFTRRGEARLAPYVGVGLGSHAPAPRRGRHQRPAGVDGAFDYSLGACARERAMASTCSRARVRSADGSPARTATATAATRPTRGWACSISPAQRIEATLLASDADSQYDDRYGRGRRVDDRNAQAAHRSALAWIAQWSDIYSTRVQVTDSAAATRPRRRPTAPRRGCAATCSRTNCASAPHLVTAALERREDALDNAANAPPSTRRTARRTRWRWATASCRARTRVQLNARHDDDSEFGGKTTGSAAYGFAITPQWRATASAGTAFRAPTLYQRFSEYGVGHAAARRTAATSRSACAGPQGATSAGVVAYRNRVSNLISFRRGGPLHRRFGCYGNTARAQYEGVTLSAGHASATSRCAPRLDLQDPRDLDTGRQLARRARRHATVGADWRLAGWTLGAEVQTSAHALRRRRQHAAAWAATRC